MRRSTGQDSKRKALEIDIGLVPVHTPPPPPSPHRRAKKFLNFAEMSAFPPAGRTPKTRRLLDPPPPPAVPAVVTGRAQRAQIRHVISTTVATVDNVIDNQAAAESSRGCAAIACRTAIAIALENFGPQSFPRLRPVVGIVRLRPLVRRWSPARRSECWWLDRHR